MEVATHADSSTHLAAWVSHMVHKVLLSQRGHGEDQRHPVPILQLHTPTASDLLTIQEGAIAGAVLQRAC